MTFFVKIPKVKEKLRVFKKTSTTLSYEYQTILSDEISSVCKKAMVNESNPFSDVLSLTKENFESFLNKFIQEVENKILPGITKISSEEKQEIIDLLNGYLNDKKEEAAKWARMYAASKNFDNNSFVQHIKSPLVGMQTLGLKKLENMIELKVLENQNKEGQEKEKKAGDRIFDLLKEILKLILPFLAGYIIGKL